MPHVQYNKLSYYRYIKQWSYSMLNRWISTAVKVIDLQFILLLSHKLATECRVNRWGNYSTLNSGLCQNVLNADYVISLCVFLCVCVRTGSALALLYGTSATLEHHHFNHAVMILQSEVHNVSFICCNAVTMMFC